MQFTWIQCENLEPPNLRLLPFDMKPAWHARHSQTERYASFDLIHLDLENTQPNIQMLRFELPYLGVYYGSRNKKWIFIGFMINPSKISKGSLFVT